MAAERIARTVRMSQDEARQVEKLKELRGLPTQQPVLHEALTRGLRITLAEQGVALYRGGRTLAQAAAEIGMPLSELFDYCAEHNVTLVQNPNFFSHMAALGRSLDLPNLTAAAERLAQEELQPAPVASASARRTTPTSAPPPSRRAR